jgi:hypothetical protein
VAPTDLWFLNASDLPFGQLATMHNAPPVVYPVGRFVVGRWWLVALCLLSAAGLIVWQIQSQVTSFTWWAAWICWGGCGVSAAIWIPRQALTEGRLGWSGESWFWQADDASDQPFLDVNISVSLDTGQGLLLWVQPLDEQGKAQGRLRSAWLQAGAMPSKWHGFRCAVYSRPMTSALSKKALQARI